MPVRALVDDCPLYDLQPQKPEQPLYPAPHGDARRRMRRRASACSRCCRARTSPRGGRCSSSTTRSSSRAPCAAPSRPTRRCSRSTDGSALAVSIDCNGRRVAADPYRGTIEAVLECAANLACVGAAPLGTTNNLNFGNPEKPHIAWQLTEVGARARRGLPRARGADRRRQRLALQRGRDRPDLPDAGDRHGRSPARRTRAPGASDSGAPAIASRSSAVRARRSPRASSAKLRGEMLPDACPRSTSPRRVAAQQAGARRGPRRARSRAPTTSPRAGSRSRSPSAASPAGLGAEVDLEGCSAARATPRRWRCSARAPAASSSAASSTPCSRCAGDARRCSRSARRRRAC